MYAHEIKPNLQKIMKKLSRRNNKTYERIIKKINEIINSNSVEHYKNLRHNLKNLKRIQIGEKVLTFSFDKTKNLIAFEDFDHHDKIYLKWGKEDSNPRRHKPTGPKPAPFDHSGIPS